VGGREAEDEPMSARDIDDKDARDALRADLKRDRERETRMVPL
jgi:hypothetical protein